MPLAIVAIGSNLGDSPALIATAVSHLSALSDDPSSLQVAPLYRSSPVDCPPGSPDFCNTVATFTHEAGAQTLLSQLQSLEETLDRPAKHGHNAPRTIDLDIISYDLDIVETETLTLPHPRAQLRQFVLQPLADLLPHFILPGQTLTVTELSDQLEKLQS